MQTSTIAQIQETMAPANCVQIVMHNWIAPRAVYPAWKLCAPKIPRKIPGGMYATRLPRFAGPSGPRMPILTDIQERPDCPRHKRLWSSGRSRVYDNKDVLRQTNDEKPVHKFHKYTGAGHPGPRPNHRQRRAGQALEGHERFHNSGSQTDAPRFLRFPAGPRGAQFRRVDGPDRWREYERLQPGQRNDRTRRPGKDRSSLEK